jgi:hypothetical protein
VIGGLSLTVTSAAAQLNSIPVYFNPKGGTGLMVAADFGRGVNDDSGQNTAFGARAALGIGSFTLGAGIASANPLVGTERQTELQYMANAALRVFGGGLVPISVSLQVGVGVLKVDGSDTGASDADLITVPLGVGVGFSIPTPGFSVEPWIAPRYTINKNEIESIPSFNQGGLGLSAGVNLGFIMGLGLHVAADWQSLPEKMVTPSFSALETSSFLLGVGVHYTFHIPGLPGVPVVPGV